MNLKAVIGLYYYTISFNCMILKSLLYALNYSQVKNEFIFKDKYILTGEILMQALAVFKLICSII